jgi:hypothetical protein
MLGRNLSKVATIALIAAAWAIEAPAGTRHTAAPVPAPLDYKIEVAMVGGTIWNPWTLRNDPVELRSWRGTGIKDGDFIAPPIRVRPGQTLRVHLSNHCRHAPPKKRSRRRATTTRIFIRTAFGCHRRETATM